jgi:hypothetical protein
VLRGMLHIGGPPSGRLDLEAGVRAAIALVVPLLVLLALGHMPWGAYASFGAFTALYGRSEPYRIRIVEVSVAGIGLLVCIVAGVALAALGSPLYGVVPVLLGVTTAATLIAARFALLPRGAMFFVFAFIACSQLPTPASEAGPRMLVALLSVGLAWALAMSGWVVRRLAPRAMRGVFESLDRLPERGRPVLRDRRVWLGVVQNGVGVLVAAGIALGLGVGHPYWAVVAVAAVMPPPFRPHSLARTVERVVGTAVGMGVAALLLIPGFPDVVLVLAAGVCQFAAELLVGWFYAAALVFVTPLAISVLEIGHPEPLGPLLVDRLLETVIGCAVGLVLVLIGRRMLAHDRGGRGDRGVDVRGADAETPPRRLSD